MSDQLSSIPDELLYIYSSLRNLGYIKRSGTRQTDANGIDISIFSKKFLLKLLNERLQGLSEFSREICEDLFKQIGVKPKKVNQNQFERLDRDSSRHDTEHGSARYPEFDEYFHYCLYHLHDFFVELEWHELDVERLSVEDSDYVARNLKNIGLFLSFNSQLVNSRSPPSTPNDEGSNKRPILCLNPPVAKSSLLASKKSPAAKSTSPTMPRRVRFESSVLSEESQRQGIARQRKLDDHDFRELHSIFALDLLIHSIDIFVRQIESHFRDWTSSVRANFIRMLDHIFNSKRRIRSKQLQLVAKRFKISLDVHLTVLDYLNEIKTTYLVHKTLDIICARDTLRAVDAYKQSRIRAYVQHCLEIERGVLTSLIDQGLQLFFGLLVCEINHPPVELNDSLTPNYREEADRAHGNMLSFLAGWLQVEDILFGYTRPKQKTEQLKRKDFEIQRPKLLAKSTLSLDSTYTSSSRIMVQMDNLCEFLKSFLTLSTTRLRHTQQTRYFLDHVATGLLDCFKIVSEKIKAQLKATTTLKSSPTSNDKTLQSEKSSGFESDQNWMVAKIRSLKLLHVTNSAEKLIRDETKRAKIKLASLDQLSTAVQNLSETCFGLKITHLPTDPASTEAQLNKTL